MRAKYVLSEVAVGLWRNVTMTIAMIITMTVSLALLGASVLMFWTVADMRDYYYAEVEVAIFLTDEVTDDQRQSLEEALAQDSLVKSQIHETKDEAYARFREQFKDAPDLVEATQPKSLPESYRVKLNEPEHFDNIRQKYQTYGGVEEIVDQRAVLQKLFDILGSLQGLSLVIALVQGLAALMLVANTIQVAAYSKRREVAIMRLVGASNWFIQAPFVVEAVFAGLIGALLAFLTLVATKYFLLDSEALRPLFEGVLTPLRWVQIFWMLPLLGAVAAVISAVTGWVTLRFYIKV
ncbi:MAG TPA: permease-like cell division protein FtsX [Micromonosporaceae bacterium]|jgi:cell division transport system permease protein|nr:permease-like cell division protein FtsX [Micromonosporaceae bacterium]